jgi:hypothetical protein
VPQVQGKFGGWAEIRQFCWADMRGKLCDIDGSATTEDEMARRTTMMPMTGMATGGGVGGKLLAGLVVFGLIALVINDPAGAAFVAHRVASALGHVIDGISTFTMELAR